MARSHARGSHEGSGRVIDHGAGVHGIGTADPPVGPVETHTVTSRQGDQRPGVLGDAGVGHDSETQCSSGEHIELPPTLRWRPIG